MYVTLSSHQEAIVRDHIANGDFADESAVVAEALRLLEEQDRLKLEHLRAALKIGFDQPERGPGLRPR